MANSSVVNADNQPSKSMLPEMQTVIASVLARSERQGYVLAREIRAELAKAGMAESLWQEVVAGAGPGLVLRRSRYHFQSPAAQRLVHEKERQRSIREAIRQLVRQQRQAARKVERRGQDRLDFIIPVTVTTEDQQSYRLLSRDLSPTGIRLVGTRRLLGQKVQARLQPEGSTATTTFLVRILWTCAVGDELFENGGVFLDVLE